MNIVWPVSGLAQQAHIFAATAHGEQPRKYTGEPYITHPVEVARLCACAGLDEEVQAAAYLHDVVEDTGVPISAILMNFGERVAQLVHEVTDVSTKDDGNRKARKAIDLEHLSMASAEGQSIKLADLIDNTRSITSYDPDFARVYLPEKRSLLRVLQSGDQKLYLLAFHTLTAAEKMIGVEL